MKPNPPMASASDMSDETPAASENVVSTVSSTAGCGSTETRAAPTLASAAASDITSLPALDTISHGQSTLPASNDGRGVTTTRVEPSTPAGCTACDPSPSPSMLSAPK